MSFTDKEEFDVDAKDCNLCKNSKSQVAAQSELYSLLAEHTLVKLGKTHTCCTK